jgi:hypothetical protein
MRTALILAGIAIMGFAAFTFTPAGSNLASIIASGDSATKQCLALLKEQYPSSSSDVSTTVSSDINGDGSDDRIVRLSDDASCGTNGCITEICLVVNGSNDVELLPFAYATNNLEVLTTKTDNFYDIKINDSIIVSWDGTHYAPAE